MTALAISWEEAGADKTGSSPENAYLQGNFIIFILTV